jgi:HK97 family phage portal protein
MKYRFNFFRKKPEERSVDAKAADKKTAGIGLNFNNIIHSGNSLTLSAVYRCVNVISDSIAQLPIRVYYSDDNGIREYTESPAHELLFRFPNPNVTRFTLLKNMICDMLLHGNAYAWIERDSNVLPKYIHYIPHSSVSLQYNAASVIYPDIKYVINGFSDNVLPEDMIHILNYSIDGIYGMSTIKYASLAIDNSMSSEIHANNFFASGANLAGVLNVESALTNAQRQAIIDAWNESFRNNSDGKSSGIAVLQGNMKYQPLTVNPVDAQLLETRKFNVTDIARFFGVSPTKLFDFSQSSYSTVEATQLSFLTDTIAPILQKFELEFEKKLFLPFERKNIDVNFDTKPLVRLDVKTQSEYYRSLYNMGAITPNEIRAELHKPPVEGGDNVFMQGAMTTIDNVIEGSNY